MNQMKRWVSLEFRSFKGNGNIDGLRIQCDSSWISAQPNHRYYRIVFGILPSKIMVIMRTCLNAMRHSHFRKDGKNKKNPRWGGCRRLKKGIVVWENFILFITNSVFSGIGRMARCLDVTGFRAVSAPKLFSAVMKFRDAGMGPKPAPKTAMTGAASNGFSNGLVGCLIRRELNSLINLTQGKFAVYRSQTNNIIGAAEFG